MSRVEDRRLTRESILNNILNDVLEMDHTKTKECLKENGVRSMRDLLALTDKEIAELSYTVNGDMTDLHLGARNTPVSYTHLTLPTILRV